jgi:hypothetical protein
MLYRLPAYPVTKERSRIKLSTQRHLLADVFMRFLERSLAVHPPAVQDCRWGKGSVSHNHHHHHHHHHHQEQQQQSSSSSSSSGAAATIIIIITTATTATTIIIITH